jgi:hypothetical protein
MDANRFLTRSRFYPKGIWKSLSHPRRLGDTLRHAPVALRIAPFENQRLAEPKSIVLFSYDPAELGNRICLWFTDQWAAELLFDRWRLVADSLWRVTRQHRIRFHNVPVDIGDGVVVDNLPTNVFCFARPAHSALPLLPNPYLMRTRKRLPRARPFEKKLDVLYFRGASTGSPDYEINARVSLCRIAKGIENADCGISKTVQVSSEFVRRMETDGILRPPEPLNKMNAYRYLLDADGNTSSWDRFLCAGLFGGVSIRYESQFEEFWHSQVNNGEHYVAADRHTLAAVVDSLRRSRNRSNQIANASAHFVALQLNPQRIQDHFEQAWLENYDRV